MKYGIPDNSTTFTPSTNIDNELEEEKKMARYSESSEYKRLKEHLEGRINFYKLYLPGGKDIRESEANLQELGANWLLATSIINEISAIINAYESIHNAVHNSEK